MRNLLITVTFIPATLLGCGSLSAPIVEDADADMVDAENTEDTQADHQLADGDIDNADAEVDPLIIELGGDFCEMAITCETGLDRALTSAFCHPVIVEHVWDDIGHNQSAENLLCMSEHVERLLPECDATLMRSDLWECTYPGRSNGELCERTKDCSFDSYCEMGSPSSIDCLGVCTPRRAEGEQCSRRECRLGLVCFESVCRPRAARGEPCSGYLDCGPDLFCHPENLICIDSEDMEGVPCEGLLSVCPHPLQCHIESDSSRCVRGMDLGEECSPEHPCNHGGVCLDGLCAPMAMPGESCEADETCPIYHYCSETALCQPFPGLDEPCDEKRACIIGLCNDGSCQMVPNGSPCDGSPISVVCESGYCADGNPRICRPFKGLDEACRESRECAGELICGETQAGRVCRPIDVCS